MPPPPNGRREIESIALEPGFLWADEKGGDQWKAAAVADWIFLRF
jgi:hypothetical protein